MAAVKYPIPNNYIVTEMNGLKGIVRRDKKGDKWIWEPFYKFIVVGKSYGKILVAYIPVTSGYDNPDGIPDCMRIASYNQKEHINARVYDVLFGENFLYIRTEHGNKIEWCLVSQDLTGGKFIGDFDIVNRGGNVKFHVPIGTTELKVTVKDPKTNKETCKILKLTTGDLVDEAPEVKVEHKVEVEAPITHYDVIVGAEGSKIKLLNSDTKALVKESQAIGEVDQYIMLIESMLGGLTRVPKEIGDKLVEFTKHFEVMVHGTVIPVLYERVRTRHPDFSIGQVLDGMLSELETGWKKASGDDRQFKIYLSGPVMLVFMKSQNGIIHVAPHLIKGEGDGTVSPESFESITTCYNKSGLSNTLLDLYEVRYVDSVTDSEQLKRWPLPYSVSQRANFQQVIGKFTYEHLEVYQLKGNIVDDAGVNYGELVIAVVSCENLKYKPKVSAMKGQTPCWVRTNILGIQLV